jgi:cobalt-zinc-cadmium efflux system protein
MPHIHINDPQEKNIRLAFLLNLTFAIAELFGGYYTNSIAIISDALHDLGDSVTLFIAWRLEKISRRGEDRKFSYGYRRFSLLGALFSAIVLITGSIYIIGEAIERMRDPQPTNAAGMLVFAVVGMAVNGYAAYRTHSGFNMNMKLISWHLIEDVLGWAAVFVVSIVMLFIDVPILDPLLSLFVTAIILYNVFKNLRKTLSLFLQGVPETVDVEAFEKRILEMDMVGGVHHTHVWSLDGENNVLTTHIVLCPGAKREEIRKIKAGAREFAHQVGVTHSTIEFEYLEEDCSMSKVNERMHTHG